MQSTTYTRIILSDWPTLAGLINKYGTPIKESSAEGGAQNPAILSNERIEAATQGPYHGFLDLLIHGYSSLTRIKLELKYNSQEVFNKEGNVKYENTLPKERLNEINSGVLTSTEKQLNDRSKELESSWDQFIASQLALIAQQLQSIGCTLSDIELKEFHDLETGQDLLNRFADLSLALPKRKQQAAMDFAYYLQLKTLIAVHSSLSRRHLGNSQADIDHLMKTLKNTLLEIAKQEKTMLAEQKTELSELLAAVSTTKD